MKISRAWLHDYVSFAELSGAEFAELITTRVAEVDDCELIGEPVAQAVAAKITEVKPHPTKAGLHIVSVYDGSETLQVVCGAPNARELVGAQAAYVPPGGSIYPGGAASPVQVAVREIAGARSCGVLASEADLQLTASHESVLVLSDDAKPGDALSAYVGEPDVVIEIDNKSLTHRPDLWCHAGFAREIAAVTGSPLIRFVDRWADDDKEGEELLRALGSGKPQVKLEIAPGCGCRRFAALEIDGVSTAPSPLWMRRRLFSIGAGVRNVLVDLSNYVMHDVGQPNHAYDAQKLSESRIVVRRARAGESFVGLDEVERELCEEDIVIADASGPVALGGVIGGLDSAVHADTGRLVLESANFDPVLIRKTSKRYALRTDASNRFEKSQSAFAVPLALQRYVELLKEVQPEAAPAAAVADCFAERPASVQVPLTTQFVRQRLGAEISDKRIISILTSLRFALHEAGAEGSYLVDVPYFRATRDISIAEDLVEEVGRVYGYENVPEAAPFISSSAPPLDSLRQLEHRLRDSLAALGFTEVSLYSFMNRERAAALGYPTQRCIELLNPVSAEQDVMRTSLVPGMLAAVERNSRFFERFGLFELGRSYQKRESAEEQAGGPAEERRLLAVALSTPRDEANEAAALRPGLEQGSGWYSLRNALCDLVRTATGAALEVCAHEPGRLKPWMHPHRAAELFASGAHVGALAEVVPGVLEDVSARVAVAEFDLGALLEQSRAVDEFVPIPKFPDSFFEISVVMPKRAEYREVEELVRGSVPEELLRGTVLLSKYEGAPLAATEKSISIKLLLGASDRTLSGEELKELQDRVVKAVQESPFALRG